MRIPLSYSIWLMPEGNTKNKLTTLIEKLRLEYGGPNFEPHVTLIGGFVKEEKVLLEKTEQLASRLSQFTVSIKGASFHDEFFRSFFLNVEQTPEFLKARRIACDIFDFEETDYIPHMSLFYGDVDKDTKQSMIKKSGLRNLSLTFSVQSLYLVKNDEVKLKWKKLSEFKLK